MFSIHFEKTAGAFPKDVLVRLGTFHDKLAAIRDVQHAAHGQLGHLVPSVLDAGYTFTADGEQLEYSLEEHCPGLITLDDVWDTLGPAHQEQLVVAVACALGELQKCARNTWAPFGSRNTENC